MNTPDVTKISVLSGLVTGAVFIAPTSVPLPENAVDPLDDGYECLGFTSDDGITISESSSSKSLRVWEGRAEVRNEKTEFTEQTSFTPVECNEAVAKATWGEDRVSVDEQTGALKICHHGDTMEPVHVVIEAVPFKGAVARYCSKSQLTERGDMTGNGQDFSGRQLTFNNLADGDGVTLTEHIAFTDSETPEVETGGGEGGA